MLNDGEVPLGGQTRAFVISRASEHLEGRRMSKLTPNVELVAGGATSFEGHFGRAAKAGCCSSSMFSSFTAAYNMVKEAIPSVEPQRRARLGHGQRLPEHPRDARRQRP